jgi:hypothetical protein
MDGVFVRCPPHRRFFLSSSSPFLNTKIHEGGTPDCRLEWWRRRPWQCSRRSMGSSGFLSTAGGSPGATTGMVRAFRSLVGTTVLLQRGGWDHDVGSTTTAESIGYRRGRRREQQ